MLTHALRMPNAKEVFFWGFWVYPPTRPRVKGLKTLLFTYVAYVCARIRVRDSSGKPAVSEANEDLQRIARPEAKQGTRPKNDYSLFSV
jgi:hypothetical protein